MLKLTDEQKKMMCNEGYSPGVRKAMTMLVEYGNVFDAERLIRVDSVHTFASEPIEFLSQMVEGLDEVKAFSTLHAVLPAGTKWASAMGICQQVAVKEAQLHEERVNLLKKIGFLHTFTCAPYLVGNMLKMGMTFSWPGSAGIMIGNSLFGARGNRDASVAALLSAITGFTPEMLLHKQENRYAELVVRLKEIDIENFSAADFGALGYYIGAIAGSRNVAVVGIPSGVQFEKLKYFLSPMPVSGAVSLCHIVGVTPEAPTLEAALGNGKPEETISVSKKEVREGYERLITTKTDQVDAVCLGCPHCTISEIKRIARLLEGRKVKEGVRLWVATAEAIYILAKRMGYVETIEKAGGLVLTDICIMGVPFHALEIGVKTSATDSARAAHYQARGGSAGGIGVNVIYGSTEQCIIAAITGKWGG
jgi:predicted aconitase